MSPLRTRGFIGKQAIPMIVKSVDHKMFFAVMSAIVLYIKYTPDGGISHQTYFIHIA